jgi:hexokinase
MPGTQGHLSAGEFFDQIAGVAAPLIEETGKLEGIGFCFSYPIEMTSDGDGVSLAFSKEVDAPEVIGKAVGSGLRLALEKRGVTAPARIVLLNDTVATLLTGISSIPVRLPSKFSADGNTGPDKIGVSGGPVIGCILGTGFNTAYPETRIPKIGFEAASAADAQIVVAESGNFFNRYQGRLDKEYDATTKNPGAYTTEKSCSGAYLGPLSLHILKQAVKDRLLVFARKDELLAMPSLQTKDLNAFLHNPLAMEGPVGSLFAKDEISAISSVLFLCTIINERAALFTAAVLAGTVLHMDAGNDPCAPARIAVEGTTYVLYHQVRRALESYLHTMLAAEKPRAYIIAPVEQASLFGAAVAALSK